MIKAILLLGAAGTLALTACSSSHKNTPPAPPLPASNSPTTAASASASGAVAVTIAKTSKGNALVGPNGHVLYTYDPDTATSSSCTGGCAANWPPLLGTARPAAGLEGSEFGTVTREDGAKQVTYDHHPLYYYARDEDGEDVYGDGVGGVWHLAKPGSEGGASSGGASASSSADNGGGGY
jgi:predicted lipoprotein with Yx(FWY)xxD motif